MKKLRKLGTILSMFAIIISIVATSSTSASAAVIDGMDTAWGSEQYFELVEYWAPTIYQDINQNRDSGKSDIPTTLDYDGNLDPSDNWEHLNSYPLIPSVYYSVRETYSHIFIEYDFYYPQDRGLYYVDEHENDLEGCLLVIKKNDSSYGNLQILETQAHDDWYQYVNQANFEDASVGNGAETIDGSTIYTDGHCPKIYISANSSALNISAAASLDSGHAVWAWGHRFGSNSANGGDGVLFQYQPGNNKNVVAPTNLNGNFTNTYDYNLVSMDELWFRQLSTSASGTTYASWGYLRGNNGDDNNVCTMPWVKRDPDSTGVYNGIYWSDPAFFIDTHFNNLGNFSHQYLFNPYFTYKYTITSIMSCADKDPKNIFNGSAYRSDIFMSIVQSGQKFISEENWKKNDVNKNVRLSVAWGGYNAKSGISFQGGCDNIVYVAAKPGDTGYINVYDADGTSGDDYMGNYSITISTWNQSFSGNQTQLTSTSEAQVEFVVQMNGQPGTNYHDFNSLR
jgi:hypothetical protein